MDELAESHLPNGIPFTLELIMEIVYTKCINVKQYHILSDAACGTIFSLGLIIKLFVRVHVHFFTEFSVDF